MKTLLVIVAAVLLLGTVFYSKWHDQDKAEVQSVHRPEISGPTVGDLQSTAGESAGPLSQHPSTTIDEHDIRNINGEAPIVQAAAQPKSKPNDVRLSDYSAPVEFESEQMRQLIEDYKGGPNGNSALRYHRSLESQAKDPSWSYQTELEIGDATLSKVSTGVVNVANVECRTSLCEVQLTRPLYSQTSELAGAIEDIRAFAEAKGYKIVMTATSDSIQDNTAVAVVMIER
jgi:hypothetical protein